MMNQNKQALEQRKRLVRAVKNWYGSNYDPGKLNPQKDTKFYLNEDYIPYNMDLEPEDSPTNQEYIRVMTDRNPSTTSISLLQEPIAIQSKDEANYSSSSSSMTENNTDVNDISYLPQNYYKQLNRIRSGKYRTPLQNIPHNWGNETQKSLEKYLQNEDKYQGYIPEILAPFYDYMHNYNAMNKLGLVGADKFFHCKAAYEATKRGDYGAKIAKGISAIREVPFGLKDGIAQCSDDWEANKKGWRGSQENKSLLDSCPTNPRDYYK